MRILVCEDEKDDADLYTAALESRGHEVVVASDGEECLRKYYDNRSFGLVILDFKVPLIDGFTIAKRIHHSDPSQRIIFASALAKEAIVDPNRELTTLFKLLPKPFEPDALVEVVEYAG